MEQKMTEKILSFYRPDGQSISLLYTRLPNGSYVHVTTEEFISEANKLAPEPYKPIVWEGLNEYSFVSDCGKYIILSVDGMYYGRQNINSVYINNICEGRSLEIVKLKMNEYRKQTALAFLQRAGIVGDDGQLAEPYRS